MHTKIKNMIKNYRTNIPQEQRDVVLLHQYLDMFPDLLTRNNPLVHITSSPWIINDDASKVLMIYHNIYDSWGWCGGHADGDDDLQKVAIKEGQEETGLKQLTLVSDQVMAIDILPVPPHFKNNKFVSAHLHINFTYLCKGNEMDSLQHKPDENSGVKWVNIQDIEKLVSEKDMIVVYKKLMKKAKEMYKV